MSQCFRSFYAIIFFELTSILLSLILKTEGNVCYCLLQVKSCLFLNLMNVSYPPHLDLESWMIKYDEVHHLKIPTRFNLNILGKQNLFLLILCLNFPTRIRLILHLLSKICCNSSLKKAFCSVSRFPNVKFCYQVPLYIFCTQSLQVFLINQQITVKLLDFC